MGQDKALMQRPTGQTLIEHTLRCAMELTPTVAVITPWPGRYQKALPTTLHQSIRWVTEPRAPLSDPAPGPLQGLCFGISQLRNQQPQSSALPQSASDWILLLACDLPNLTGTALADWWQWLAQQTDPSERSPQAKPKASLVKGHKGWEPLCGFYTQAGIDELMSYQRTGGQSFQKGLSRAAIAPNILPYPHLPTGCLFNCNQPSDWAQWKAQQPKSDIDK